LFWKAHERGGDELPRQIQRLTAHHEKRWCPSEPFPNRRCRGHAFLPEEVYVCGQRGHRATRPLLEVVCNTRQVGHGSIEVNGGEPGGHGWRRLQPGREVVRVKAADIQPLAGSAHLVSPPL